MTEEESSGRAETEEPGPGEPAEEDAVRRATGLAVVAAAAALVGFVSFFRLRVGWDDSRAGTLRRLLGVQVASTSGVVLGLLSLHRLRDTASDRRGVPFAVTGVVLGMSNLVRSVSWLRRG